MKFRFILTLLFPVLFVDSKIRVKLPRLRPPRRRRHPHHHDNNTPTPSPTTPFIREQFNSSNSEQKQWIDSISNIKASGEYDSITNLHGNQTLFNLVHQNDFFLPWHRWYLSHLEEKTHTPTPYWDWLADANDLSLSSIWDSVGHIGINGSCLSDGPFATWNTTTNHCIKRVGHREIETWNRTRLWTMFAETPPKSFRITFETGPHASIHLFMGGTMTGYASPDDPVFWLHHSFVDYLWFLAQEFYDDPTVGISPSFIDEIMPATNLTPRQVVSFASPVYTGLHFPFAISMPVI